MTVPDELLIGVFVLLVGLVSAPWLFGVLSLVPGRGPVSGRIALVGACATLALGSIATLPALVIDGWLLAAERRQLLGSDPGLLARLNLGVDGVSAPLVLLVSGVPLVAYLLARPGEKAASTIPALFASSALLVALTGQDLLLLVASLLALELGLALLPGGRPSLLRMVGIGAILFACVRFAALHGRAFGEWTFAYDALIRMTLPPPVQKPIALPLLLGLLLWIIAMLIDRSAEPDERARESRRLGRLTLAIAPALGVYLLLRLAIALLPHAARAAQPRTLLVVTAGAALLGLLAFAGRRSGWAGLAALYVFVGCVLALTFDPVGWQRALSLAPILSGAWAVDELLLRGTGPSSSARRVVRAIALLAPVLLHLPGSLDRAARALGPLSGVLVAGAFGVAVLGTGIALSRAGGSALPSAARRRGVLLVLTLSLVGSALALRSEPAIHALIGYTRARVAHPPPPGELRFEHAGQETAPTPAIGVHRSVRPPGVER